MIQELGDFWNETLNLIKEKKYKEAEPRLETMLGRMPRNTELLYLLGTTKVALQKYGIGIALLERATDLGANSAALLTNLGNAYVAENNPTMAALYYEMSRSRPDFVPDMNANMATLYIGAGQPEQAVELCDRALDANPRSNIARFNRSLALLEMGRWDAFRDYHESSLVQGDRHAREYALPERPCPEWDGTKGKTIVLHGEQGIGDEIMFASCIPDAVRDCDVIIECDDRLEPLFRRSFPEAQVYGTLALDEIPWPWWHSIDAFLPIAGLPQFYRKFDVDFPRKPYLLADDWQIRQWHKKLPQDRPTIAISWIGGLKKTRVEERSVPLDLWQPILALQKEGLANFISLQWHPDSAEEAKANGVEVNDGVMKHVDFAASLMSACDLVISVTNTNAHLAGALGVECWCLTPKHAPWAFCGEENAWYGSVKHYRQDEAGKWAPVIERVASDLRERLTMKAAAE